MSGLDLLSIYNSDSEDDNQVNDKNISTEPLKRLPLPGSIVTWKGIPHHEEIHDNPSEHDGRIRTFKHERGNWATLSYINYEPSETMLSWMMLILKEVPVKCNIFSGQFHISLTRTLILKFHWIESIVEEIKKLSIQTDSFNLELLSVRAYTNEEKTRTFLGVECVDSQGILTHFVENLNKIVAEYKLAPFYEDVSYHISFLWCLGNEVAVLNDHVPSLTTKLSEFLVEYTEERFVHVSKIHLKIGDRLYAFQLR